MKFLILILCFLSLVACDRPAKKLDNFRPEAIKFVFTQGGELRAKGITYDEDNNSLSVITKTIINAKKNEELYEAMYSFLREYNKSDSFYNRTNIPYYHVIVGYISFEDSENNTQSVSIGDSWLAYYVRDDYLTGETSNIIYKSSKKAIDELLIKLVQHEK